MVHSLFVGIILMFLNSQVLAEANYQDLPSTETREAHPAFMRFPDWQNLELIRNGEINPEFVDLTSKINVSLWRDLAPQDLETLQLDKLDLNTQDIENDGSVAKIYFLANIRYQEKGAKGAFAQGTLVTFGQIQFTVGDEGPVQVIAISFDDSSDAEKLSRKAHTNDSFNGYFVTSVIEPVLAQYFADPVNRDYLNEIAEDAMN